MNRIQTSMRKYAVNFERALQKVAPDYGSVCSEQGLRWSLMGPVIWLEIELIDGKTFMVTNHLHGSDSVKCCLGRWRIESKIKWAFDRLI